MQTEKGRAAGWRPTTRKIDLLAEYRPSRSASSPRLLELAADILAVLAFLPVTQTEHVGLTALLERRLRDAYGLRSG